MKTQIITLESHDDLISVRDRLSWAKTPRILLVWPKGVPIALRPLDLKVLQRHADSLGAQLGIITRRSSVRREAEALGLPVYKSNALAQKQAWPALPKRRRRVPRPPRRGLRELRLDAMKPEAAWRSDPLVRVTAFSLGVLAVLALVSLFVPRAVITLHPESRVQRLTFQVSANPSAGSAPAAGMVPTREETVIVAGEQSLTIAGRITVPQTPARGLVRFRNLTQAEVVIPAGTVIYAPQESPVRFRTTTEARVDPGLDASVDVAVEATDPGARGNLPVGEIRAIEGPVGLLVTVDNPNPTTGGSDRSITGADTDDRLRLRESLLKDLKTKAEADLREGLAQGEILLADTLTASEPLEETYDPPAGMAGTSLRLAARVKFSAQVVSGADLARIVQAALNASVPPGFSPAEGSLSFKALTNPQTDTDGTTRWQLQAERRVLGRIDPASLLEAVRGRPVQAAESLLAGSYVWDRPPEITLRPAWWPWLPLVPFRTSVSLQ
ncbi:MAG: baseplate J/gp47 family protein [Bacteroidota bacterium]